MKHPSIHPRIGLICALVLSLVLAACGGAKRDGGYYEDDGPGGNPPSDPHAVPDAAVRDEPLLARANRPYSVFGRRYVPMTERRDYRERGVASWYGRKFHGNPTSSGEKYDMYAMSAAHPTLPIPSFVRVTNLSNGRQVVVRVNDRGPFLNNRLIDLSWTAAAKLDFIHRGHTMVEVELLDPVALTAARPVALDVPDKALAPAAPVSIVPPVLPAESASAPAQMPVVQVRPAVSEQASAVLAPVQSFQPLAEPAPTAASQSVASVPAPAAPVHHVQLGAFSSRDNAQLAAARLARQFDWLRAEPEVTAEGRLFKVRAGPWPSRAQAEQIAQRIRRESALKPYVVSP